MCAAGAQRLLDGGDIMKAPKFEYVVCVGQSLTIYGPFPDVQAAEKYALNKFEPFGVWYIKPIRKPE
jgi:hypothetical protein